MKTDSTLILGRNIKNFREDRDLSQADIAEKTGITRQNLSLIETGNLGNPGIQTILKIANALEVGVDDLLAGIEPTTNAQTLARFEKLEGEYRLMASKYIDFLLMDQRNKK